MTAVIILIGVAFIVGIVIGYHLKKADNKPYGDESDYIKESRGIY